MEKLIFNTTEKIRIDEFLRRELPEAAVRNTAPDSSSSLQASTRAPVFSNSKIRRLIVAGAVSVNARTVNIPSFELRGRSQVCVNFESEKFFYEKQPDDIKFEVTPESVLFEDENLIFIDKPAFFPVEQTITGNRANLHDAVVDFLWKRSPQLRNPPYVGIMHRLDRDTSGVILFTKNRAVNKPVSEMFQTHNFVKEYKAVVSCCTGKTLHVKQKFTVENYLGRISGRSQAGKFGKVSESEGGLYAKTDFEVTGEKLINGKKCYEIKCMLYTGRTHQIRVHLSESGFPIAGDALYGGISADRMMLHACRLSCTNEQLNFDVNSDPKW